MEKNLYIDASRPEETRVVLKSKSYIEEYESENKNNLSLKNNIYLAIVSRVEPSLQAAFVNFGRERHGFLAFNDIQSDYYQIPKEDKSELKKAEEKIREDLKEKTESEEIDEKPVEENTIETKNNGEGQAELKSPLINNHTENPLVNNHTENPLVNNHTEKMRENLKNRYGVRKYRIQEVIKPGQVILIQVLKEERGQKGAALTTFISIAGKYVVLMPNTAKGGGISRKIFNYEERNKIRGILNEIEIPKNMGLIVRTAGSGKSKNEINNDLQGTVKIWEEIKNKTVNSNAPILIHEEGDIIKRAIRDMYDNNTKYIYIEGNDGYQKAKNFIKQLMPRNSKYVKKYRGKIPLFHNENIEQNLNKIFDPIVKLKSGGYLVISPTEALVAIDINSGQSTKQVNIEKTAVSTNLEAAEEIARQIKIRDLSGLIVIDFIDMINFHNKKIVERKIREKLKQDRARIQIGKISNFGLLEMTRQRLKESSVKWEVNLSLESFAQKVIKKIEMLAFSNKTKIIEANIPEKVKHYLESHLNNEIKFFQKKYKFKIVINSDKNLLIPEYKILLLNKNKKIINKVESLITINENNKINKKNVLNFQRKNDDKNIALGKTLWTRRKKRRLN